MPYVESFMSDGAIHGLYRKFDLNKLLSAQEAVEFTGHVTFGSDSGGFAIIPSNAARVDVVFNNPYEKAPVITTSPYSSFRQNYIVADVTAKGFTILLESSAEADLKFSWQAVPTGQ